METENESQKKMKVPIWDERSGMLSRILRYDEAKRLIAAVDPADQGKVKMDYPWTRKELRIFLQVRLFTGLRFADILRVMKHPELYQEDGSILMSRNILRGGKEKVRTKSFTCYTSDLGRQIIEGGFFDIPVPQMDSKILTQMTLNILIQASKKAGFEVREFQKEYNTPKKDQFGLPLIGEKGQTLKQKKYREVNVTGINNLTFRKTWDSWLINSYGSNSLMQVMIEKSMGHSIGTALEHYLTFQFDNDDMEDIRKATAGFGPRNFKMPETFNK